MNDRELLEPTEIESTEGESEQGKTLWNCMDCYPRLCRCSTEVAEIGLQHK